MKISGNRPIQSSSVRRGGPANKSAGVGFASNLSGGTAAPAVASSGDAGAVNALLSVQEVGDQGSEDRRRSVRRGEEILDSLDELRLGLLTGTFPAEKLDHLLETVRRQHERVLDPRLRDVLREIEVRASVELAKLDRIS